MGFGTTDCIGQAVLHLVLPEVFVDLQSSCPDAVKVSEGGDGAQHGCCPGLDVLRPWQTSVPCCAVGCLTRHEWTRLLRVSAYRAQKRPRRNMSSIHCPKGPAQVCETHGTAP